MDLRPSEVTVLVNPWARGNREYPVTREAIRSLMGSEPVVYVTGSREEVPLVVREILRDHCKLLVTAGGDGTIHILLSDAVPVAREMGVELPTFLFLRGGTMNVAPNNLGSGRSPLMELMVLGSLLRGEAIGSARLKRASPLQVECSGLPGVIYGFVFANGIAFRILKEYYNGEPSPARAFNVTASVIAGAFVSKEMEERYFPQLEATVIVDGRVVGQHRMRLVVASSLTRMLLWFSPFDEATERGSSQFNVLANFMDTRDLAAHFWSLCRGRYQGPGHFNGPGSEVRIEGGGGFTVDGEVYEVGVASALTIRTGPSVEVLDLSEVQLPTRPWVGKEGLMPGVWT